MLPTKMQVQLCSCARFMLNTEHTKMCMGRMDGRKGYLGSTSGSRPHHVEISAHPGCQVLHGVAQSYPQLLVTKCSALGPMLVPQTYEICLLPAPNLYHDCSSKQNECACPPPRESLAASAAALASARRPRSSGTRSFSSCQSSYNSCNNNMLQYQSA